MAPRPPLPSGAEHDTVTAPGGIAALCCRAIAARHAARSSCCGRSSDTRTSATAVIAPQRHQIAIEVLAQRGDLVVKR